MPWIRRGLVWVRQRLVSRVPRVGDAVWWAPRGVGAIVTDVRERVFVFQGGEIVKNRKGREVPRWTVSCAWNDARWSDETRMWIVGQGSVPRVVRGTIVTPDPVALSGSATGSFAVSNRKE